MIAPALLCILFLTFLSACCDWDVKGFGYDAIGDVTQKITSSCGRISSMQSNAFRFTKSENCWQHTMFF